MLYTVRPLERVFADPSMFDTKNNLKSDGTVAGNFENKAIDGDYKEVLLPNGRIVTRRVGKDYVIERVHSTDMKDYLNNEYMPGKSYREKR